MPKLVLACLLGWLPGFAALAQSEQAAPTPSLILEQGVGRHAGIDAIYAAFSASYQALDAAAVAKFSELGNEQ